MTIEEALAFAFGKKSGTQLDEQIVMITLAREVERLQQREKELEAQVILEMANTTQQAMRVEELVAAAERFRDEILHEHDGLEVNYILGLFDDSIGRAIDVNGGE